MKNNTYSVELAPLGYASCPRDEADLKRALRAVLQALQGMHQAGFVHRDVRWSNILRDPQVGLIALYPPALAKRALIRGIHRITTKTCPLSYPHPTPLSQENRFLI